MRCRSAARAFARGKTLFSHCLTIPHKIADCTFSVWRSYVTLFQISRQRCVSKRTEPHISRCTCTMLELKAFLFIRQNHCMSPHAAMHLHTSGREDARLCNPRRFGAEDAGGAEASLCRWRGVSKWSDGHGAHGPSLRFLSLTALLDSRACQEGRAGL